MSCLRRPGVQLTAEHHDQLLATIEESLGRLSRVAASLLDMSQQEACGTDGDAAAALTRDRRADTTARSAQKKTS